MQCHHAGCHYDKCRYTECRGALKRGLPGRSTKAIFFLAINDGEKKVYNGDVRGTYSIFASILANGETYTHELGVTIPKRMMKVE
jgi:hypothetical protein